MQECPKCHKFLKNHTELKIHIDSMHPEIVPENPKMKEPEKIETPEKVIEKIEKIIDIEKEPKPIQEQEAEPEQEQKPQSSNNIIFIVLLILASMIGIFIFFKDKILEILFPEEKKQ
jgi:outer membrane biosynthesis protein TonB